MKPKRLFLILLIAISISYANVGGVFYTRGITGLSSDSSTTIISAETTIDCEDSTCTFKSSYRVNKNDGEFRGRFYGLRFSGIKLNGKHLNDSLIKTDTIKSDSAIFERNWVIEKYTGETRIASIPIITNIPPDSMLIIEGTLHTSRSTNWGLTAYPNMVSLRHPWLQKPSQYNNEFNVTYLLAPIQSFKGLKKVTIIIQGKNIELFKRMWHRPKVETEYEQIDAKYRNYARHWNQDKSATQELKCSTDTSIWNNEIPDVVEYFYKIKNEKMRKTPLLSPGGPVVFIGVRRKIFHSEIGWEASINPINYLSILPSATAAFNDKGYMDWTIGLRGYFMGLNLGVITREFKTVEITFGIDVFGIIGLEGRNDAFLGKLSM